MKRILRIFSLLFVALLSLLFLASCETAGTELADLMIIQGIGVDRKDNMYTVTVEILNNEQSGSPSGDSTSENKTKIYTTSGATLSTAFRQLTSKSGNLPLFAHNRVIVLGKSVLHEDTRDLLDFFIRNYDSRASQIVCVAKDDDAEKIIRAKLLNDTVKSEILENLLNESNRESVIPQSRIIDVINAYYSETGGFCIPCISINKNGENEDFKLSGGALFNKTGFLKYINEEESQGLSFLNNQVEKGYLSTTLPDNTKASFLINKCKTKYEISVENGEIVYYLKIEIHCDLDEISKIGNKDDETLLRELKIAVGEELGRRCSKTLGALQGENGTDAIRYGKRLSLYRNNSYEDVKSVWDEVFPTVKTRVGADVTIRRVGEEVL